YTYLFLFTAGSARTFLWPASSSLLPAIVPRKYFAQAVTWNSSSFQLSSVAGPALGGLLIALTKKPSVVYVLGFVTAITCGLLVASLSVVEREIVKEKLSMKSLLSGFSFVFKTRLLLGTITLDLFAVLLGGATTLLPAFAKDVLGVGPGGLGWLQGALPLGSFCMALFMAHRKPMQKAGRALFIAVGVFGLATIGFGFSKTFLLSFICLAVCGAADNISIVVRHTLVQLLTPDDKRGRVSAVNSLFIGTSNELGGFESGLVAEYFGLATAVVAGGIGTILVAIVIAGVWPEVRKYGSLTSDSK
ncbi:MAG: transporter, partial [Verrucomicrobiales bacterium]|nr:transporter [Verrucomicrobiales bacterium]